MSIPPDKCIIWVKVKNIHERKILRKENVALKAFFGMNKKVSIIAKIGLQCSSYGRERRREKPSGENNPFHEQEAEHALPFDKLRYPYRRTPCQ